MRYLVFIIFLIGLAVVAYLFVRPVQAPREQTPVVETPVEAVQVVANGLEIPWDVAFLPGGDLLVSERPGRVLRIAKDGTKTEISFESAVKTGGEGGLLGIVLHPNFSQNNLLYLYLSSSQAGVNVNRVERYRLLGNALIDKVVIIDKIPGAIYHDGGRMEFGPDGLLYITTGDATRDQIAQDKNSLGGKVLRLTDDGSLPQNPFGSAVYSYGHRNPQGLAWDSEGRLWETEHGRSGALSGYDEINIIKPGENYGWPTIEGDETQSSMQKAVRHSGANDTWAPASLAYFEGSLYFGGLRGEALYEAVLSGENVVEIKAHFKNTFGRIRTVRVGPDNMLYLTTSNRDGRGNPQAGDDKILRIDPAQL